MNEIERRATGEDAYSRILRFMTVADIALQANEEIILDRWVYCDVLLRQRKHREEEIIEQLCSKFPISPFTARNDIYYTQNLFAMARMSSKKYLLDKHIEDIAITIEKWKSDKSLAPYVPKLMDAHTKAIQALPEDNSKSNIPAPILNFNILAGQVVNVSITPENAALIADEIIKRKYGQQDE